MLKQNTYRNLALFTTLLFCLLITIGNFTNLGIFSKKKISLGLDLRGGSHLLLQVDFNYYMNEQLNNDLDSIKELFLEKHIKALPKIDNNTITIYYKNEEDLNKIKDQINKVNNNFNIKKNNNRTLLLTYKENYINTARRKVNRETVEIIRKRIDEYGTKDSLIQTEGDSNILIQVAGLSDSSGLKELIGKTAKLTFHLVSDTESEETITLKEINNKFELKVNKKPAMAGDSLIDAGVSYENGKPVISFRFNNTGAKKFSEITKNNIGRVLAIVLDNKIITAPRINGRIDGGSGIITGDFTVDEATKTALLLRSGSLVAPLNIIEEKVVGATLGHELIEQGIKSCIYGLILLIVFIFFFYKTFGIFSNITVLINIVVLLTLLSLFNITLTLPGIAGIILTIGMSTDATILIFERIKEEYRRKVENDSLTIIENGFNNTLSTIYDSNLTTAIVAIILYIFGSGAVKGFAVILGIGIIATIFSSIICLKIIITQYYKNRKLLIK